MNNPNDLPASQPTVAETAPVGPVATTQATTAPPPEAAASTLADWSTLPDDDPTKVFEKKLLEGQIIAAIREIYDPEIPVNIYELGLIYQVDVKDDRTVYVQMTLTAPACPVAGTLPGMVEQKVESVPNVKSASVELVWDPPWSRDMMSEAAQLQLGLM